MKLNPDSFFMKDLFDNLSKYHVLVAGTGFEPMTFGL